MSPVEVYFQDQLVGHYKKIVKSNDEIPSEVPILNIDSCVDPNLSKISDMIWIPTQRRNFCGPRRHVADTCLLPSSRLSKKLNMKLVSKLFPVPPYAEYYFESCKEQFYFHWNVLNPSTTQYEILFDDPMFEPV